MARICIYGIVALALSVPAGATLIVVVPSADGVVIAADGRISLAGVSCDNQYKITELKRPARTVIAVTGEVAFISPPAVGQQDVCAYLKSAPRQLDISSVVKHSMERRHIDPFTLSLGDVGAECARAIEGFQKSHPAALEQWIGREIFSVVIVSYDPRAGNTLILNFVVRIDSATHQIQAGRFTRNLISAQTRRGVYSYGEADYLNANVFGGVGRKYLSETTRQFILADKPITEVPLSDAVAAATNIIEAASLTTKIIPSPSGIGGPVDVILLGKDRRPKHIAWKTNP